MIQLLYGLVSGVVRAQDTVFPDDPAMQPIDMQSGTDWVWFTMVIAVPLVLYAVTHMQRDDSTDELAGSKGGEALRDGEEEQ